MPLKLRLLTGCLLLVGGNAAHLILLWQLAPVRSMPRQVLRAQLDALPTQFDTSDDDHQEATDDPLTWTGVDHRSRDETAKKAFFADDVLMRTYRPAKFDLEALIYAAFSRSGEDRNHHPEICVRDVLGAREDLEHRTVLYLNGSRERPVQRFRFQTGTDAHIMIYYWYYALTPSPDMELTHLQQVYRRNGPRSPSVTVQVSTAAAADQLEPVESSLLVALDRELRASILPLDVTMGCDRLAIALRRR